MKMDTTFFLNILLQGNEGYREHLIFNRSSDIVMVRRKNLLEIQN